MAHYGRWTAIAVGVLAVLVLAAATPAQAAISDCNTCPVSRKLGRGLANTLFGVVELPAAMIETSRAHGQVAGFFVGSLRGVCRTIGRVGSGLIDVVLFPFPLPREDYGPIMEPEFPPNLTEI